MQIFAFTTCRDFQALLEVECKELTGARPVIRESLHEFKNLISLFQSIDVLIIDSHDVTEIREIEKILYHSQDNINHIFVYGEEIKSDGRIKHYSKTSIENLFKDLTEIVSPEHSVDREWTSIPLCTLTHFKSLPFDLYLKLSKTRFVKRIPAFEATDQVFTDSLEQKGISEVYCERKHKRDFSMMLINNMINRVEQNYENEEELFRARDEVFTTTQKILQNLGLTGRMIEVCDSAVEKMVSEIMKQPGQLKSYLLALKKDKAMTFHFKLIHLTNYIGSQLIQDMALPEMEDHVKKFVFASFFCDMCLLNQDFHFYRKAHDSGDDLTLAEQNEVNFHALRASEMVSSYPDLSKEIKLIILQHHGSFSGIGFPVVKSSELLPLSKILIVAQDLAFAILRDEEAPALEVLKAFLKKSNSNSLQDLLDCLEESLLSKAL